MSVGVSSLDNCKTDSSIIFCADKYDGRGYVILYTKRVLFVQCIIICNSA